MSGIVKKRLQKNFKQTVKYFSLIFNDFFILALFFLFGGLLFWYANVMKTLPTNSWYYKPILLILLYLPFLVGKFATFLQEADSQFLWPLDQKINEYFKGARLYSMILPTIVLLLVAGLAFPFAVFKAQVGVGAYALLVIGQGFAKYGQQRWQERAFYYVNRQGQSLSIYNLVVFIALALTIYGFTGLNLLIAVLVILNSHLRPARNAQLDWFSAIDYEAKRQETLMGFYSLFTDVAQRPIKIKRRTYLDFLLPAKVTGQDVNQFLFQRTILRNPEFLNLFVRMTVFGVLIVVLVGQVWWSLGLDLLVSFLTGYQLLPMYQQYETNMMYLTMPIDKTTKGRAFQKIMQELLIIQAIIFIIFWLFLLAKNINLLLAIVGLVVGVLIIIWGYLALKIKKLDRME